MKKILALLIAIITVFSITACSSPQTKPEPQISNQETEDKNMEEARLWLEERIEEDNLFSFDYDSLPYAEHISEWEKAVNTSADENGNTVYKVEYKRDGVIAEATVLLRKDMPCIDYVCNFTNTASENSKPISNILPLCASYEVTEPTINYAFGGNSDGHDFEPLSFTFEETNEFTFESFGGRSSQGYMPFYDVVGNGGGIVVAIGWTGQWTASFLRNEDSLTLMAGMSNTDIALYPNESMRTPSIVMTFFSGDRVDGNQVYRDMVQKYYTPVDENGEPITHLPFTLNGWGGVGEEEWFKYLNSAADSDWEYELAWMDAGWHGNIAARDTWDYTWANEVGNWYVNTSVYPEGLSNITEKIHSEGKEFLLWFEPERVISGTDIDVNHPEYVMPSSDAAQFKLYNLANDEATDYLIETISSILNDNGVDWYRQDFNCDPLNAWAYVDGKEGEHRTGITEIKYITNLYRYLDALLEKCPGLMIDNCASGGRRLDIEMMKRSAPMWRSDYYVLGANAKTTADGTRNIAWNLSYWIPLSCGGSSNDGFDDSYEFRTQMGSGLTMGVPTVNRAWWDAKIDEYLTCREMMNGDYYILAQGLGNEYDRKNACYEYYVHEEGKGFIMAFRPEKSVTQTQSFLLRGLDADATYTLELVDNGEVLEVSGETLMKDGLTLTFNEARMSLLIYLTKK